MSTPVLNDEPSAASRARYAGIDLSLLPRTLDDGSTQRELIAHYVDKPDRVDRTVAVLSSGPGVSGIAFEIVRRWNSTPRLHEALRTIRESVRDADEGQAVTPEFLAWVVQQCDRGLDERPR